MNGTNRLWGFTARHNLGDLLDRFKPDRQTTPVSLHIGIYKILSTKREFSEANKC